MNHLDSPFLVDNQWAADQWRPTGKLSPIFKIPQEHTLELADRNRLLRIKIVIYIAAQKSFCYHISYVVFELVTYIHFIPTKVHVRIYWFALNLANLR